MTRTSLSLNKIKRLIFNFDKLEFDTHDTPAWRVLYVHVNPAITLMSLSRFSPTVIRLTDTFRCHLISMTQSIQCHCSNSYCAEDNISKIIEFVLLTEWMNEWMNYQYRDGVKIRF